MKKNQAKLTSIAYSIAAREFCNVLDRGGRPYFEHCLNVSRRLGNLASDEAKQVAILHDVVEDTDVTLCELANYGFSNEVIYAIDCLTKRDGVDYDTYIERIKGSKLATLVKLSDLRDNSDIRRLKGISDKDIERTVKYMKSFQTLKEHAIAQGWIVWN